MGFVFAMWLATVGRIVRAAAGRKMKWKTCSTRASSASSGRPYRLRAVYNLPVFLADPLYLFRVWDGGMSFHGGLIGVIR
ncbi:prolipoprotein diacylglyceryl transferase [Klebsiella pneumoniae]|uniref:Prolipoprotein diacylglyceryl transferase n=1 Tax=Klebsiella pneumoniae TaxID=573 RepID=A0A939SVJ8_KLEPN|nr:prolipoprotein diacylglyceryl transferase [Klebsiella pneumoniae]